MAYLDRTDPRSRATAIAGVAAVHTALAVALLSMSVIADKKIDPPWKPFVITPDPVPPPPDPAPSTPAQTQLDPPVSVPAPPVPAIPLPLDPPQIEGPIQTSIPDGPVATLPSPTPTPAPQPTPTAEPSGARPANSPGGWITTDDYPAQALRQGIEGVAGYRVIVSSAGRVASCEITRSTGNRALDQATCRQITRRARFDAARDGQGQPVVGSFSGSVRWEIPD